MQRKEAGVTGQPTLVGQECLVLMFIMVIPLPAPAESAQPKEQQDEQQPPQKVEEPPPPAVIEPNTTSDEENASPLKKKRTSFAVSPNRAAKSKPVNEIPEQGVQMRGYVHRKKGTFGGWERTYAVVTYAAIYFTSGEEIREYHHVCLLNGSGTVKLEKKGHDKQSEGLLVRSGKNKETLSLPSSEVNSWRQVMEEVLGVSQGSLEFGSDEEGEGAGPPTTVPRIEEGELPLCILYQCTVSCGRDLSLLTMSSLYMVAMCSSRLLACLRSVC